MAKKILPPSIYDPRITGLGNNYDAFATTAPVHPEFGDYAESWESPFEVDQADLMGQRQGAGEQLLHGIGKGMGLFANSVIDGLVTVPIGIGAVAGGLISGDIHDATTLGEVFIDNPASRVLDLNSKWLEDYLPNYQSNAEKAAPFYKRAFGTGAANFWGDAVTKNLLMAAGYLTPGKLYGGAINKGVRAAMGLNKPSKVMKGISDKAVKGALSTGDDLIAGVTDDAVAGITNMEEVSKVLKDFRPNLANNISSGITSVLMAVPESIKETYENKEEFRTKAMDILRERYGSEIPQEEIDAIASLEVSYANQSLLYNMAILSASNLFQWGGSYVNKGSGLNVADDLLKLEGKKLALKSQSKWLTGAKGFISRGLPEGSEELSQFIGKDALVDYVMAPQTDSYREGFSVYLDAVMKSASNAVTSSEGMENFFIGAFTGGVGLPAFSRSAKGNWALGLEGGVNAAIQDRNNAEKIASIFADHVNKQGDEFSGRLAGSIIAKQKFSEESAALRAGKISEVTTANPELELTAETINETKDLLSSIMPYVISGRTDMLMTQLHVESQMTVDELRANNKIPVTKNGVTKMKSVFEGKTDEQVRDIVAKKHALIKDGVAKTQSTIDAISNRFDSQLESMDPSKKWALYDGLTTGIAINQRLENQIDKLSISLNTLLEDLRIKNAADEETFTNLRDGLDDALVRAAVLETQFSYEDWLSENPQTESFFSEYNASLEAMLITASTLGVTPNLTREMLNELKVLVNRQKAHDKLKSQARKEAEIQGRKVAQATRKRLNERAKKDLEAQKEIDEKLDEKAKEGEEAENKKKKTPEEEKIDRQSNRILMRIDALGEILTAKKELVNALVDLTTPGGMKAFIADIDKKVQEVRPILTDAQISEKLNDKFSPFQKDKTVYPYVNNKAIYFKHKGQTYEMIPKGKVNENGEETNEKTNRFKFKKIEDTSNTNWVDFTKVVKREMYNDIKFVSRAEVSKDLQKEIVRKRKWEIYESVDKLDRTYGRKLASMNKKLAKLQEDLETAIKMMGEYQSKLAAGEITSEEFLAYQKEIRDMEDYLIIEIDSLNGIRLAYNTLVETLIVYKNSVLQEMTPEELLSIDYADIVTAVVGKINKRDEATKGVQDFIDAQNNLLKLAAEKKVPEESIYSDGSTTIAMLASARLGERIEELRNNANALKKARLAMAQEVKYFAAFNSIYEGARLLRRDPGKLERVMTYLNTYHPNLGFTLRLMEDNKMSDAMYTAILDELIIPMIEETGNGEITSISQFESVMRGAGFPITISTETSTVLLNPNFRENVYSRVKMLGVLTDVSNGLNSLKNGIYGLSWTQGVMQLMDEINDPEAGMLAQLRDEFYQTMITDVKADNALYQEDEIDSFDVAGQFISSALYHSTGRPVPDDRVTDEDGSVHIAQGNAFREQKFLNSEKAVRLLREGELSPAVVNWKSDIEGVAEAIGYSTKDLTEEQKNEAFFVVYLDKNGVPAKIDDIPVVSSFPLTESVFNREDGGANRVNDRALMANYLNAQTSLSLTINDFQKNFYNVTVPKNVLSALIDSANFPGFTEKDKDKKIKYSELLNGAVLWAENKLSIARSKLRDKINGPNKKAFITFKNTTAGIPLYAKTPEGNRMYNPIETILKQMGINLKEGEKAVDKVKVKIDTSGEFFGPNTSSKAETRAGIPFIETKSKTRIPVVTKHLDFQNQLTAFALMAEIAKTSQINTSVPITYQDGKPGFLNLSGGTKLSSLPILKSKNNQYVNLMGSLISWTKEAKGNSYGIGIDFSNRNVHFKSKAYGASKVSFEDINAAMESGEYLDAKKLDDLKKFLSVARLNISNEWLNARGAKGSTEMAKYYHPVFNPTTKRIEFARYDSYQAYLLYGKMFSSLNAINGKPKLIKYVHYGHNKTGDMDVSDVRQASPKKSTSNKVQPEKPKTEGTVTLGETTGFSVTEILAEVNSEPKTNDSETIKLNDLLSGNISSEKSESAPEEVSKTIDSYGTKAIKATIAEANNAYNQNPVDYQVINEQTEIISALANTVGWSNVRLTGNDLNVDGIKFELPEDMSGDYAKNILDNYSKQLKRVGHALSALSPGGRATLENALKTELEANPGIISSFVKAHSTIDDASLEQAIAHFKTKC
jgi:uncharacterized membrane protein